MGFPVIQVRSRQEENDKRILQLSQQRFLADGTLDENNPIWMVPIEIATSRSPTTPSMSFVLEGEKAEIVLNDIRPDEWFKVSLVFIARLPTTTTGSSTNDCFFFLDLSDQFGPSWVLPYAI